MKKYIIFIVVVIAFLFQPNRGVAEKTKKTNNKQGKKPTIVFDRAGCNQGSAFRYIDVNNIRARINSGGDMFYDLIDLGTYEIPKGSGKTSIFTAALWLGGKDSSGGLRLAAHRFRQGPSDLNFPGGFDYSTGPLTIDQTASTTPDVCAEYDKLFPMTRAEVDEFIQYIVYDENDEWVEFNPPPDYKIPSSIIKWPAHGDIEKNQSYYLAPFVDVNEDGDYHPEDGDYPDYNIGDTTCQSEDPPTTMAEGYPGMTPDEWTSEVNLIGSIRRDQCLKGDETLWWIFNDNGNAHTETFGTPIGVEIRAQAFGFETNNEINNMTFYSYEIINRSTFKLNETYFCQWVDADLGFAWDDFVGCDILRGLGYTYNGEPIDGGGQPHTYGGPSPPPPAVGVDYFQGPYIDPDLEDNPAFDGVNCDFIDWDAPIGSPNDGSAITGINFGDGYIDNERFGMRAFVYHDNSPGIQGDPDYAQGYYNLMQAKWANGVHMSYGGNAYPESEGGTAYGPDCMFMFPGDTDPCYWGTGGLPPNGPVYWTEETENNPPDDRRMMQSAGPFTLTAGAVNYITVGIPWARAASGGPFESVRLLRTVDDKAQALFDNCFDILDGPDAPDLTIRELDQQLIVYITNKKTSNNYNETYIEKDPLIILDEITDSIFIAEGIELDQYYRFEGYQIYQLISPEVLAEDLSNPDYAREIFNCDVKNGVTELINHIYNGDFNANVPVSEAVGTDQGVIHSFSLTVDAFSGKAFVNHKPYYFRAIAYAYNEYMKYTVDPDAEDPPTQSIRGQKVPYFSGRKNIATYTAIPHKIVGYTQANSEYGDKLEITRIQGQGNGGNVLKLTQESIDEILSKDPVSDDNQIGSENYPIAYNAKYKEGFGPINVKIIDPLKVVEGTFRVVFDTLKYKTFENVTGIPGIEGDTAGFYTGEYLLLNTLTQETFKSEKAIDNPSEKIFPDLGISVDIRQVYYPGLYMIGELDGNEQEVVIADNNGFIEASIEFDNEERPWLSGVRDFDFPGPLNWIRSGNQIDNANVNSDFNLWFTSGGNGTAHDPDQVYETVLLNEPVLTEESDFEDFLYGSNWAPYKLCATIDKDNFGPAYRLNGAGIPGTFSSMKMSKWSYLSSVQITITNDKTKWSRCPVIEMNPFLEDYENDGGERFFARNAPSVNVDGDAGVENSDPMYNSNYIRETGMGWFPGYAINLETGERLNIVFGEDSYNPEENGADMIWNPTSEIFDEITNYPSFGGKHYIYVFGNEKTSVSQGPFAWEFDCPAYDAGKAMISFIDSLKFPILQESFINPRDFIFSNAMWVNIPVVAKGHELLSTDVTINLNVSKPYARYYSKPFDGDSIGNDYNGNYPVYEFSTEGYATKYNVVEKAKSELDRINVVPNPYLGYNNYEVNQLDNRVRITNLPPKTFVTIYNLSGIVVRKFNTDKEGIVNILRSQTSSTEAMTSIDWDIKNHAGIPVASGVYLIHIDAGDLGERVIKWFGVLRPIDLNAF